ncbi:MAG: site-specific integrase [Clostridiales bacterium]|nr:site-specific integrase [Clostridiales bacterium]
MANTNAEELLQYLSESGKINLGDVENDMKKSKLEIILKEHPHRIYQGKDGRWHTYVTEPDGGKRKKISKSTEDKLHDALYDFYTGKTAEAALDAVTLEKLYPKWLEFKSLHTKAEGTISRLKSDWRKFYEGTDIVRVPVRKLTKVMLDEWMHILIRDYDMSRKQFQNMITIMNQALDYAVDLGLIEQNPSRKVKVQNTMFRFIKKKPSETQVFSEKELAGIKDLAWEDYRNKTKVYELAPLAVLFQFLTGVRIGELCALRHEDVDGYYIHVRRMVRRDEHKVVEHTKGGNEDRLVPLPKDALEIIEICKRRQQELGVDSEGFIFSVNGEYCSYYAISDLYRKYCRKLGIEQKSSHKARKTYISKLLDASVNSNTVREVVGHADEHTTLNNYHFDLKTKDERVQQIEAALA